MQSTRNVKPPVFNPITGAIRALAMDAVQQANSGHPGAPMGMAEIAEVLWRRHLRHNPANPKWADRDRFVLSNGHGSMLIYALLHLTGYDLPIEELKRFRQLPALKDTPIVAMTANAFADDRTSCIEAGMDDFLPKPVDPDLMFSMLLRWLRARKA